MNNLSSYCGLVDAKIGASDKDLPVCVQKAEQIGNMSSEFNVYLLHVFVLLLKLL